LTASRTEFRLTPAANNVACQPVAPSEPLMNPSDDQVEALLKDILNGQNN